MSRHLLRSDAYFEVVVGYDDPLGTFFTQVYDVPAGNRAGDDVLVVQTGTRPSEVTNVAEVAASVEPYALLTDGMKETLERERGARQLPTEFQRDTFKRLTGEELP